MFLLYNIICLRGLGRLWFEHLYKAIFDRYNSCFSNEGHFLLIIEQSGVQFSDPDKLYYKLHQLCVWFTLFWLLVLAHAKDYI